MKLPCKIHFKLGNMLCCRKRKERAESCNMGLRRRTAAQSTQFAAHSTHAVQHAHSADLSRTEVCHRMLALVHAYHIDISYTGQMPAMYSSKVGICRKDLGSREGQCTCILQTALSRDTCACCHTCACPSSLIINTLAVQADEPAEASMRLPAAATPQSQPQRSATNRSRAPHAAAARRRSAEGLHAFPRPFREATPSLAASTHTADFHTPGALSPDQADAPARSAQGLNIQGGASEASRGRAAAADARSAVDQLTDR